MCIAAAKIANANLIGVAAALHQQALCSLQLLRVDGIGNNASTGARLLGPLREIRGRAGHDIRRFHACAVANDVGAILLNLLRTECRKNPYVLDILGFENKIVDVEHDLRSAEPRVLDHAADLRVIGGAEYHNGLEVNFRANQIRNILFAEGSRGIAGRREEFNQIMNPIPF